MTDPVGASGLPAGIFCGGAIVAPLFVWYDTIVLVCAFETDRTDGSN